MKKLLATLLSVIMLIQMLPFATWAASEAPLELVATINDKTVTVKVKSTSEFAFGSWSSAIIVPEECSVLSISKGADYDSAVGGSFLGANGTVSITADPINGASVKEGNELYVFSVDVSNCKLTEYSFGIKVTAVANLDGDPLDWAGATVTSNTVTETVTPPTPTSDYSIYYELKDNKTDDDSDAHPEYGVGDTVTAEVSIVSNKTDITLQAYDIYLTYDNNLSYQSQTLTSGAEFKDADGKLTHIQAVGADTDKPISIPLTKGEANSLGTITFKVLDSAVYDTKMPITLTVGESGESLTNIGVGTAGSGNPTSYYPQNTGTVEGVEIMDQHTVSFNTDGGTPAIETQFVGHNKTATKPANPDKTGFEFAGWYYTVDGQETAFDFDTKITHDIGLTAKWNVATAKYTVEHWQQNVESADYVKVEADTETKSGQTGAQTEAVAKTYEGFTAQTVTQATIAADGSTVVKIYYDRNSYTLTWNDGTNTTTSQVKYGATIVEPTTNPTKTGYAFDGWDMTLPTTMPAKATTITAKWNPITYKVTYNGNENTSGSMTESTFTYDATGEKLTENAFSKTGYTFNGWNTKADGTGTPYTNEAEVENWASEQDATINLFAQWKANTYTVTFNANGGSGDTMESQNFEYDKAQTLKKNTYTNEGYSFAGWSYGGKTYSDEASVLNLTDVNGASVEMLAQWTKQNTIKVIADSTKGSATTTPISAIPEQTVTVNITPNPGYEVDTVTYVKEGSDLTGDATKINDTTYTFSMPDGNAEVTVTFTAIPYEVTVTEPADGTGTVGVTGTTDGKATVGTVITLTNTPEKGYELDQYIVDGSPVTGNTFTMPAKAVTVTATFKPIEYTITYDLAGGTVATENPTAYKVTTEDFMLNNPTKVGYTFAGWTGSNGTTAQTAVTITKGTTGNLTYTANWTAAEVTYTVNHWQQNLNAGDEENATNFTKVKTDSLKGYTDAKVTPSRESYEGFAAPEGEKVTIKADGSTVVNYYYTRNAYNIVFDANGGTGSMEKIMGVEYGAEYTLPQNTFTKPGYTFAYWSYGNATYTDGSKVTNLSSANNVDVTLSAVWTATPYTITLNPNGGTLNADGWTETNDGKYTMSYDITKTITLPGAENGLYVLSGWQPNGAVGNWETTLHNANTSYSGRYGNVELTAQWNIPFTYAVEEYKYAYTDYVMLRIATESNVNPYSFAGEKMFYTEDPNYQLDVTVGEGENKTTEKRNVFVTLIPKMGNVPTAENGDITAFELTSAAMGKLSNSTANDSATVINRNGDVNGDTVVNIADANVVYQMVKINGGYYSIEQLDTYHRLVADMNTEYTTGDYRGTTTDVDAIVNKINGVTPTT